MSRGVYGLRVGSGGIGLPVLAKPPQRGHRELVRVRQLLDAPSRVRGPSDAPSAAAPRRGCLFTTWPDLGVCRGVLRGSIS